MKIPSWKEIKDQVIKAVAAFPELNTLGWDVAFTEKGIYFLEANAHWGSDIHQITLNRGLKGELKKLFQIQGGRF